MDETTLPHWQLWLLTRSCETVLNDATRSQTDRLFAIRWLSLASGRVDSAMNGIARALGDTDLSVREIALDTVEARGKRSRVAIPNLAAQLSHTNRLYALNCAVVLLKLGSELDSPRADASLISAYQAARPAIAGVMEEHLRFFLYEDFDHLTRTHLVEDPAYRRLIIIRGLMRFQDHSEWSPEWSKKVQAYVDNDWANAAEVLPVLMKHLLNDDRDMADHHLRWVLERINRVRPEDEPAIRKLIADTVGESWMILRNATTEIDPSATNILRFLANDPHKELADLAKGRLLMRGVSTLP
ncbi:MAG: hypothetical protein WD768_14355 [Phycisphaeraceae bacterium]